MPRSLLTAFTLASCATALAGCSALPDAEGDDETARNFTAIGLALVDVDLPTTVVELGDAFTADATVVNQGDVAAADTLQVRLGDVVLLSEEVDLRAKEVAHVDLEFTLPGYGAQKVTFAFGTTAQDVTLRVRAPELDGVRFEFTNLACKPRLPFTLSVHNAGDGVARDVVVFAEVVNMSDIVQSNGTKTIATIPAGERREVEFDLFAPDVCEQEDYFRVRATFTPRLSSPLAFVSDPLVL